MKTTKYFVPVYAQIPFVLSWFLQSDLLPTPQHHWKCSQVDFNFNRRRTKQWQSHLAGFQLKRILTRSWSVLLLFFLTYTSWLVNIKRTTNTIINFKKIGFILSSNCAELSWAELSCQWQQVHRIIGVFSCIGALNIYVPHRKAHNRPIYYNIAETWITRDWLLFLIKL